MTLPYNKINDKDGLINGYFFVGDVMSFFLSVSPRMPDEPQYQSQMQRFVLPIRLCYSCHFYYSHYRFSFEFLFVAVFENLDVVLFTYQELQ